MVININGYVLDLRDRAFKVRSMGKHLCNMVLSIGQKTSPCNHDQCNVDNHPVVVKVDMLLMQDILFLPLIYLEWLMFLEGLIFDRSSINISNGPFLSRQFSLNP